MCATKGLRAASVSRTESLFVIIKEGWVSSKNHELLKLIWFVCEIPLGQPHRTEDTKAAALVAKMNAQMLKI